MPATLPAPPPHGSSEMMIRRLIRVALALAMVGAATPAFAIHASFYTYDGFAETDDAFRLVPIIFADPRYETLVIVIATVAISLAQLLESIRGHGMGLVAIGFQMLMWVGRFGGTRSDGVGRRKAVGKRVQ